MPQYRPELISQPYWNTFRYSFGRSVRVYPSGRSARWERRGGDQRLRDFPSHLLQSSDQSIDLRRGRSQFGTVASDKVLALIAEALQVIRGPLPELQSSRDCLGRASTEIVLKTSHLRWTVPIPEEVDIQVQLDGLDRGQSERSPSEGSPANATVSKYESRLAILFGEGEQLVMAGQVAGVCPALETSRSIQCPPPIA